MIKPLYAPIALATALVAAASSPALADTLIHNANGVQVDAAGKLERFVGLIIGDDGKVVQLIRADDEKQPARISRRIDAGGKTLLPGLIDAHGHVVDSPGNGMGLGLASLQLDLNGVDSIAELQRRLGAFAAANPDAPWIQGRGWNQELFRERRMPTAQDLDQAVAGRPVWLERVDGHAAVGNAAAMKLAGIGAQTRDPVGGRIERDKGGVATGLFVDNATALMSTSLPAITAATMDRALVSAQNLLLANGITTVADMGTSVRGWETMKRLGSDGRLAIRIISYADGLAPLKAVAGSASTAWLFGDRLRMGGVKLYTDGALGSRGAWLKAPYTDKPDTRGLRFLTDAELIDQARQAAGQGYQLAIHAIGDAANQQVIAAYEQLAKKYPGDRRWRLEHAQVLDIADLPRLSKTGIIASMQPTHQTSDRTMAEARLGPDRLAGAYAWQTIAKSGVRLAFGSDFPVESPNPFPGLAAAVSRQGLDGQPEGGWRPQERVSFEAALAGFTRGAAYAGFADDKIGSLDPGKYADFILVDRDVSTVSPGELGRTEVLETWVAGKKVWQRAASAGAGERGR